MTGKRVFVLNGHPAERSLSRAFADAYAQTARARGHEIRLAHLHDLRFDADLGYGGYSTMKPLEPDLELVLDGLEWCEHLVLATPMWWGGLPAKLKGLIDRAFLPGRTFDTRNMKGGVPQPLLDGRSARVILTCDTPWYILRIAYKNALIWQLRGQTLGFVGIKPTRFTYLSGASHAKDKDVKRWLKAVRELGANAA